MGFWQDLWHSTQKVFSRSCPNCKTNDADLPSDKRIIRRLLSQRERCLPQLNRDHNGRWKVEPKTFYEKRIKFKFQSCGHEWIKYEENSPWRG